MSKKPKYDYDRYKKSAEKKWDSLDKDDQAKMLFIVVDKLIHSVAINRGGLRSVLYGEFDFPQSFYPIGVDSGLLDLINMIDPDSHYYYSNLKQKEQ